MDLQAILDSTITTSVEDEDEDDEEDRKGSYPPQFRSFVGSNIPDHGLMSDSLTEDDDYNHPDHLLVDNDEYDEDEDEREGHRLTKPSSLLRPSKTYSTRTVNNNNNNSKATPYTTHPNSHGTTAPAAGSATAIATATGMGRGMDVVDLERILREDDDDDDPEDDDDSASDHLLFHSRHQPEIQSYKIIPSTRTIPATTTSGIITTTTTANTPSSTSPEDWHVLQAILGEEEDDMEVVTPMLHHSQNVPVDTILQQSDDDDDDDDEYHDDSEDDLETTMIHNDTNDPLMILPQYIPQLHVPLKQGPPPTFDNNNNNTHHYWEEDMDIVPATQSNESFQTAHQSITDEPIIQNQPHHHQSQSLLSEPQQAKASEKAMQYAQHYEDRLLKATLGGSGVAHNYNKDIVSPLMVKRRLKPKIYLQSKNSHASTSATGSSSTRGVATTPISTATSLTTATGAVELRHMHGVSATLAKQFKQRSRPSHQSQQQQQSPPPPPAEAQRDLPTALGMNDRFLAVGMQSGVCLIFDLFETFRKKLDKGGDTPFDSQTAGAVTTLDLSFEQGDVLVAGYTSGYIVLWDVLKGVALRTVIESPTSSSSSSLPTPPSCMTHVRFLKGLEVVTVDAGGLVNKLAFTKNLLWSSYSVESECLLDGTAGQILAMNVLDPTLNNHSTTSTTTTSNMHPKGLVLIALSSERSSFAVAVAPAVHVLYRWARPSPESVNGQPTTNSTSSSMTNHHTTQVYLPCLTWGWALVSGGDNVKTPILARAWGCAIQLLRASFQDQTTTSPNNHGSMEDENPNAIVWPAFGVHDEFASSSPVVAMEWLNDRSLVYLSVHSEFTVVDTVMMTLVEKIDCSGMSLVYAEFSLSRSSSQFSQQEQQQQQHVSTEDSSPTFCTTFQNSIRSRDNRLLLLCQEELQSVSIVGAKRRISQLEQDGEWLEALASALDHYESTIMSQQDRRRELRKDLTKHPEYASTAHSQLLLSPDEEWIAKLLIRYMNIGMENAPDLSDTELAQSHFQMLAGVCVEFCVVTKRLDLLYGPIFRRFHSVGCLAVFLDVLEPYILNDKLDYIAPEAMAHFVEHCRLNNGMSTVERCLLHMDVTIMDFDSILTLLKANEMYSALFYVYNQGLDDYSSPLEILLEKLFDASDTLGSSSHGNKLGSGSKLSSRKVGAPTNDLEKYGYKAILYLQYCFQGRTFPQNVIIEDEQKLSQIRSEILLFLLQENFTPKSVRKHTQLVGRRTQIYPYTTILLLVDPKAMLQTLSLAMDAPDGFFQRGGVEATTSLESIGGWEVEVGTDRSSHHRNNNSSSSTRTPDRQEIIRMLSSIILPVEYSGMTPLTQTSSGGGSLSRSQPAINALLDFLAEYLMKGVVRANKQVTLLVLNRMATRFESAMDARERLESQQRILDLLTALPHNSYEPEEVLVLVQKSGIHRAALLLHQEGASSWGKHSESQQELEHRAYHFKAAIDCYLDDDDSDFCKEVFLYVKKECSGISSDYQQNDLKGEAYEPNLLRTALASKLADLVQLDSLLTAELIAELFVDDLDSVVSQLHDEQAQFLFFQAIISGALDQKDQVAGAVLNTNLTVEHHHRYLELMAKLHPDDVYEYLQTHDNYRPEACLPLCQQYDIADASCYLLERMGNVTSGLQLILQTLDSRMMGLKRIIRGMGTSITYNKYSAGLRHPKLASSNSAAVVAMDATEREIQGVKRILIVALDLCERNSGTFSSRTEHGSRLWFNVLDRLINAKGFLRLSKEQPSHARIMAGVLSDLLRLVMQRMVSSVPLPDLVRKVTSDHSGSRLGELREMVESLLSTYGFELTLFEGAVSVFHYDMKNMRGQHRSLRIQGDRVASKMNAQPMSDATNTALQRRNDADPSSGTLFAPTATSTTSGSSLPEGESQGLGTALLKLQRRRQFRQDKSFSTSRHPGLHHRRTIINLMPESERRIFVDGHVNPDATYWEDRVAGLLGNAEHSGRFRSFFY
jgi:hypothetical protein